MAVNDETTAGKSIDQVWLPHSPCVDAYKVTTCTHIFICVGDWVGDWVGNVTAKTLFVRLLQKRGKQRTFHVCIVHLRPLVVKEQAIADELIFDLLGY